MNSDIEELNLSSMYYTEPKFELNLSSTSLFENLDDAFSGFSPLKRTLKRQSYDIPRDEYTSRLSSNVVTYIARK